MPSNGGPNGEHCKYAMAIGDALAAVWMEQRGISPADFALNHPAGSLGKQLTMTAADLMVSVKQNQSLTRGFVHRMK